MTILNRKEAKQILASIRMLRLTIEDRQQILIDLFSEDEEYLRIVDIYAPHLNKVVVTHHFREFAGVRNEYLADQIKRILGVTVSVVGSLERMAYCPCCTYKSIPRIGEYDICPVCFWEDDGIRSPDKHSGPNHLTLAEAKVNFVRYGSKYEKVIAHLHPDRMFMYFGPAASK